MFIIVGLALAAGIIFPIGESINSGNIVIIVFAYMTLITALGTSLDEFARILVRPWIPVWILVLIHLVSPLLAWFTGLILFPNDSLLRIGLIIGASIPMAVTSIIWTGIAKGDAPLALVSVTLDTFIAPFWLPVFFKIVGGHTLSFDYRQMVIELFIMVTLPSLLGIVINELTSRRAERFANSIGGLSSKIALFIVVYINASIIYPDINWDKSIIKIFAAILILVIGGYLLGYLGAKPIKNKNREMVTAFMYSVGMRNISFGTVIALTYFPPVAAIPVTLMMLFQQPIAAIIANYLNGSKNVHKKQRNPDNAH